MVCPCLYRVMSCAGGASARLWLYVSPTPCTWATCFINTALGQQNEKREEEVEAG